MARPFFFGGGARSSPPRNQHHIGCTSFSLSRFAAISAENATYTCERIYKILNRTRLRLLDAIVDTYHTDIPLVKQQPTSSCECARCRMIRGHCGRVVWGAALARMPRDTRPATPVVWCPQCPASKHFFHPGSDEGSVLTPPSTGRMRRSGGFSWSRDPPSKTPQSWFRTTCSSRLTLLLKARETSFLPRAWRGGIATA